MPLALTASKPTAGEMPTVRPTVGGTLFFEYDSTNGAEYVVRCESLPKDAEVSIGAAKATVDASFKCTLRVDISERLGALPITGQSAERVGPADPLVLRVPGGEVAQIAAPGVEVANAINALWRISKGPLKLDGGAPTKGTLVYLHRVQPGFAVGEPKVLRDVARIAIGEPVKEPELVCMDAACPAPIPANNAQLDHLALPALEQLGVMNGGYIQAYGVPYLPPCETKALAQQLTPHGWTGGRSGSCPSPSACP